MSVDGTPVGSKGSDQHKIAQFVLRDAVVALNQRGKIPTAAGVNSELRRLTVGGFSFEELGFATFREFLSDAERAGIVQLTMPAPGSGLDVMVSLPGDKPRVTSVPREPARRLRRDLWRAFMNWDADKTRVVDRETGQVSIYPTEALPLEPAEVTRRRSRVTSDPSRFLLVEPISLEQKVAWAEAFVQDLPEESPAKSVLRTALAQQLQLAAFTSAVRGFPEAQDTWHRFRLSQVRDHVASWVDTQGLTLELDEPTSAGHVVQSGNFGLASSALHGDRKGSALTSTEVLQDAEEAVRARLLAVLSRLTLDELLQLRIPARYILER